jgi:hypothetical protein
MGETLEQVEYKLRQTNIYLNEEGTISAAKTNAVIPVPPWAEVTLQCYVSSAPAEFQVLVTANKHETIQNGTPRWFALGANKTDHLQIVLPEKVTGIKLVRVSGTINWAVVAA